MNQQLISVAMTTYNGERFLRPQLESLAAQTLAPAELVVCDDGSNDATVDILRAFARRAPFPVRMVVNAANLGWRANFMQAANLTQEPLIAFCDQDDVWYPRKLEVMASLMQDAATLLSYHDGDIIDEAGQAHGRMRQGKNDPFRQVPLTRPIHWESPFGLTLMFRRSLLAMSDLWGSTVDPADQAKPAAHDQWFVFLASCFGDIRFSPEALLGYRQHGANVVGFSGPDRSVAEKISGQTEMIAAFCRILERLKEDPCCEFKAKVPGALATSCRLRDRFILRRQLRTGAPLTHRAAAFSRLVMRGAYSRRQAWNFGYRNLVADLRAVVRGG